MKRAITVMAAAAIVATSAAAVMADPSLEHCDAGDETTVKVEEQGSFLVGDVVVTIAGATVTFADAEGNPVDVNFCAKAAGSNSGMQTGSSFTVDWLNGGGQTPDISYVAFFGVVEEEPPVEESEPPVVEE